MSRDYVPKYSDYANSKWNRKRSYSHDKNQTQIGAFYRRNEESSSNNRDEEGYSETIRQAPHKLFHLIMSGGRFHDETACIEKRSL